VRYRQPMNIFPTFSLCPPTRPSDHGPISWKQAGALSLLLIPLAASGFAATSAKQPPASKPAAKPSKVAAKPAAKPASTASPGKKVDAYFETIPNSVVKFEMAPVQGGSFMFTDPSKGNKPAKTE